MKVCQVTNIPAPYRERVHEEVTKRLTFMGGSYVVVYSSERESNRLWKNELGAYNYHFLKGMAIKIGSRFIHLNLRVMSTLSYLNPDVLIIGGYGPTAILSVLWAKWKRRRVISLSDSTIHHESNIGVIQRKLRSVVLNSIDACIGASIQTRKLFESYGVDAGRIWISRLCVNNIKFYPKDYSNRSFDLMFSSQFIPGKNPLFFVEVVKKMNELKPGIRVLLLGSGPMVNEVTNELETLKIDYSYPGFVDQSELPGFYNDTKLFLFPTSRDAWGLVVNEACASGTPVLTTSFAGVADDLIKDNQNGFILDLDVDVWVDRCLLLLDNKDLWRKFSEKTIEFVGAFTPENSAEELVKCVKYAYEK